MKYTKNIILITLIACLVNCRTPMTPEQIIEREKKMVKIEVDTFQGVKKLNLKQKFYDMKSKIKTRSDISWTAIYKDSKLLSVDIIIGIAGVKFMNDQVIFKIDNKTHSLKINKVSSSTHVQTFSAYNTTRSHSRTHGKSPSTYNIHTSRGMVSIKSNSKILSKIRKANSISYRVYYADRHATYTMNENQINMIKYIINHEDK